MKNKNFEFSPDLYDLQVNWTERLKKEEDFFSRLFKDNRIESVLDIGCGTGHHAEFFSGYAKKVLAIDPSGEAIDYARKNVVKSTNVTLLKEGFEGLEKISHDKFDLITCLGEASPNLKKGEE